MLGLFDTKYEYTVSFKCERGKSGAGNAVPCAMNVLSMSTKASLWPIADTTHAIAAEALPFSAAECETLHLEAAPPSAFYPMVLVCILSSWKGCWSLGAGRMYEGQLTEMPICFTLNRFANFQILPLIISNLNITQIMTQKETQLQNMYPIRYRVFAKISKKSFEGRVIPTGSSCTVLSCTLFQVWRHIERTFHLFTAVFIHSTNIYLGTPACVILC